MTDIKNIKDEIAYFMRRLYSQKLTTTSGGNISFRINDEILITPSQTDKGRIQGNEIGQMKFSGEIIGEVFKPSIETQMHIEIYKQRPDITAIVHAHPINCSMIAASKVKIETKCLSESYAILGDINYADYGLMGTELLADNVGQSAKTANCIIMSNHGATALGNNLLQAFDRLEVLENAAQLTLNMRSSQIQVENLNDEELKKIDKVMGR